MQGVLFTLSGLAAGALGMFAWLRSRLARHSADAAKLHTQLAEAAAAQVQLADLRRQLSSLRHDVRGILSPALLVSDGLLTHTEPKVRRAGEVMVRTVERASERLADAKFTQNLPTSSQQ